MLWVDGNRLFQSTRPIRGATLHDNSCCFLAGYFNPRAPYGARRGRTGEPIRGAFISIHAPHTGRDLGYGLQVRDGKLFQSTRPIRGATGGNNRLKLCKQDFNPRAPYGARHLAHSGFVTSGGISIHAPHTGRDVAPNAIKPMPMDFNPRAPYGARPHRPSGRRAYRSISIHAPHTGRDMY